jgi:hypothetical protein
MTTTKQKTKTLSRKQVRETAPGRSISAWVILNPDNKHVATVQAAFLDSGIVMVDVWGKHELIYQGKAGGGGYDKFIAALSGAVIDGIEMYDHSVRNERATELLDIVINLPYDEAERICNVEGYSIANWHTENKKFRSVFVKPGLDRLADLGYKVIKAI